MRVHSSVGRRRDVSAVPKRLRRACSRGASLGAMLSLLAGLTGAPVAAETLQQALAGAYQSNPKLDAERARLRATDEDVPRALAGFRPQVTGSADKGRQSTDYKPASTLTGDTIPWGYQINVSQSLFSGFRTTNAVNEAEANVRAGRESLRNVEQTILLEAVTAFSDVVRDHAVVRLRENNVSVLTKELTATEARRAVREVTRTDVAQSQARRARAISQLDQARANLKASRATFEKTIGHAANVLTPPSPPNGLLTRTLEDSVAVGEKENPNLVAAMYREQAARFAIDKIRGELLPEVRVEASYGQRYNTSTLTQEQDTGQVTGRLTIPLYEGGETYARVRQAKHIHISRLQEIEQNRTEVQAAVVQAWSRFVAIKSQIKSDQVLVESNRVALEGVREEERVSQRTLLDVLNAEQELLDAQVQLVTTRRDLIVAAYTLLQHVGRLNAEHLGLGETIYDSSLHYEEVHAKWFGLDITRSDGRVEQLDVTVESDPGWAINKEDQ